MQRKIHASYLVDTLYKESTLKECEGVKEYTPSYLGRGQTQAGFTH